MKDQIKDSTITGELLRLVEQSIWANLQWIEFVYSQLAPETRPKELLGHIIIGEKIWFERIDGAQKTQTFFPVLTKDELLLNIEKNRKTFLRLIEENLEDIIHFKRGSGEEYQARVIDIIHQVLTHGYHHRGQLALHYAKKGLKYPNTDHINFLIVSKL